MNKIEERNRAGDREKGAADFNQETWDKLEKDRNQIRHIEGEGKEEKTIRRWKI